MAAESPERLEDEHEDEYEDALSNVPSDFVSEADESSEESSEESDEDGPADDDTNWSHLDSLRTNEAFSGPRIVPNKCNGIKEMVDLFMGDDLFEHIAAETNRYRSEMAKGDDNDWRDVDVPELKKWLGLVLVMGLVRKAKIIDYWSTMSGYETPIFNKTMSRGRFFQILQFLHFSNNRAVDRNSNRLSKVQYLIDYFGKKFQNNYYPGRNISLDEDVIPWHGKLKYKTYKLNDISKYGILVRTVRDSATGYVSTFKLYTDIGQEFDRTTSVMDVLKKYNNNWHHLYMGKMYNGVDLSNRLYSNKIRVCGTISSKALPEALKKAKLKIGETTFLRKGEILIQLYKTNKRRAVGMISTIHNSKMLELENIIKRNTNKSSMKMKPVCVTDHCKYTKGSDRANRFLNYYPIYRKTKKWTKKVAFYLINCAIFNSFKMYLQMNSSKKRLEFQDFLLKLASVWIDNRRETDSVRLSGNIQEHNITRISTTAKVRRRCRVCYSNTIMKFTPYWCELCKAPLHIGDCFQKYHTP